MVVTPADALAVLPLAAMKVELRIEDSETSHDGLITGQIVGAISHLHRTTSIEPADMPPALRAAAVAIVRAKYDGLHALPENPSFAAWLDPFRSYKTG